MDIWTVTAHIQACQADVIRSGLLKDYTVCQNNDAWIANEISKAVLKALFFERARCPSASKGGRVSVSDIARLLWVEEDRVDRELESLADQGHVELRPPTALITIGGVEYLKKHAADFVCNEMWIANHILQVLLNGRRGGLIAVSARMLHDILQRDGVRVTQFAIWYLMEKGFIEANDMAFGITEAGVIYLKELPPEQKPPGDAPPRKPGPSTGPPGWWPPRREPPDDPSRVSRRSMPPYGGSEIALTEPAAEGWDDYS